MDNASKALIMAASILIALLLLSSFVYVFRAGASLDEAYDASQNTRQLELFNSNLEIYDTTDNTIEDIITAANFVYSTNVDVSYDEAKSISFSLVLGSKTFSIPSTDSGLKRNQILDGSNNIISIYNLMDTTIGELGASITDVSSTDKLSNTKLGTSTRLDNNGEEIQVTNATIYEVLFKCKEIKYNSANGRVSSIEFEAYYNKTDWENN